MRAASSRAELDKALAAYRGQGLRIALVPTMGALHEGHASLINSVRRAADAVVVSIFVNPLQFGPDEDLTSYPRPLSDDLALCDQLGVDVVFVPSVEVVYPAGEPQVSVDPGPLGVELEGAMRPGHFRGVLTVVTKLFGMVGPALAAFGEKDFQQLFLVRRCVADLCLPVEIIGVGTVRAPDGVALSSRNRYLGATDRQHALALSRALHAGREAGSQGSAAVLAAARAVLAAAPAVQLDYLELRGVDFEPAPSVGEARLLLAAWVGATRLIDNVLVRLLNVD